MFELKQVTKTYTGKNAGGVRDVSLSVRAGEVVCVLGKSGSGKSTLLRVMAELEHAQQGTMKREGGVRTAYVSQEYALWPHLNVLQNIILAPTVTSQKAHGDAEQEALALLKRFGLREYVGAYPHQLSGGQRQRIALIRAIITRPNILLLDEITSALDPMLTKSVLDVMRALAKDGYTMVIVTHHMSFALSVADRIVFMEEGKIIRDEPAVRFFSDHSDAHINAFVQNISKHDAEIEVFSGAEQFQAYHLRLLKRLPEGSTIYVAGSVGDAWYEPMGEMYEAYERLRIAKKISWHMVSYTQGDNDRRLLRQHPELNQFRPMPRAMQNPANYNVFGDTVITQIFTKEPTIIEIKNPHIATAYMRFFEELWETSRSRA
ncbi:MAG: ATP-binding cassette domain-containing protein [Candidatus Kerfeldbacteria bacterium]|nr:ATP-binding cassette domain-containing protein [Candidatus Kerfeldbacteria bacterium]